MDIGTSNTSPIILRYRGLTYAVLLSLALLILSISLALFGLNLHISNLIGLSIILIVSCCFFILIGKNTTCTIDVNQHHIYLSNTTILGTKSKEYSFSDISKVTLTNNSVRGYGTYTIGFIVQDQKINFYNIPFWVTVNEVEIANKIANTIGVPVEQSGLGWKEDSSGKMKLSYTNRFLVVFVIIVAIFLMLFMVLTQIKGFL